MVQKYHLNHHFRVQDKGYGITSSFWDKVFGTLPPSKLAAKSRWFSVWDSLSCVHHLLLLWNVGLLFVRGKCSAVTCSTIFNGSNFHFWQKSLATWKVIMFTYILMSSLDFPCLREKRPIFFPLVLHYFWQTTPIPILSGQRHDKA